MPKIAELEKVRQYNKEVTYNWKIFQWYWDSVLPQVCSKHRWGANLRRYCTISGGTVRKDPSKNLVTVTDEAFAVVSIENCDTRFPYIAKCKISGAEVDTSRPEYQTRWCDNAAGQKKFGGWTNPGRQRFSKLVVAIAKNRVKDHVPVVEQEMLREIQGTPEDDAVADGSDSEEKEETYGGLNGVASFFGKDSSALAEEDGESDVEELDDKHRAPPKPKAKSKAKKATKKTGKK